MDIIGTGRNGVVYRAYFGKERVAVKVCDIWKRRELHTNITGHWHGCKGAPFQVSGEPIIPQEASLH